MPVVDGSLAEGGDPRSSLPAFTAVVAAQVRLLTAGQDPGMVIEADTRLADLPLDSLSFLELVLVVEELGLVLADDDLGPTTTFADLHHRLRTASGAGPH